MAERIAIYPGSFDPPTNGHLDIVERSSRLFDRVVVGVGKNLAKKTVFDADQRVALMREACERCPNVEVRTFDGLQVDFAKEVGASFIIRGIRALSDFEFEFEMGNMNRTLAPAIVTIPFRPRSSKWNGSGKTYAGRVKTAPIIPRRAKAIASVEATQPSVEPRSR